jgi:hypothetical protein
MGLLGVLLVAIAIGCLIPPLINFYCKITKRKLDVYHTLANAKRSHDFPDYDSAPHISERVWDALGAELHEVEAETEKMIPSSSVITLRIQLVNFNHLYRSSIPFRDNADEALIRTASTLLSRFRAQYAYVQQGEITLLIPRTSAEAHIYGGRREDLIANATAITSTVFTSLLIGFGFTGRLRMTFSCKIGAWKSERQAFQLILRRTYTALRNGVNRMMGPALSRKLIGLEQLKWCQENHKFPAGHKAYGTLVRSSPVQTLSLNKKTGKESYVSRREAVTSSDNLLNTFASHTPY